MKYALIVTGVLAGLAFAVPGLVVLGFFLLIIPGLILACAPTVFVYLAATATLRRLIPTESSMVSTAVAFGVSLLLGWAVMQPFRVSALRSYQAEAQPDVIPDQQIQLTGHVRLEMPDSRNEPECDYLCLTLLDSPAVDSVTIVTAGKSRKVAEKPITAFALVEENADAPSGIFPTDPGNIIREYRPLAQAHGGRRFMTATKAVEAQWAIRLSDRERIREATPVDAADADWVITIEDHRHARKSTVRRTTIADAAGNCRFRSSYRKQSIPASIFYLGFNANFSGGFGSNAYFHIGQETLTSGSISLRPEAEVLSAIRFSEPTCDESLITELRQKTEQALDNPDATNAQLDLAKRYLGLFFFDAKEEDHRLIAQIMADARVRDIDEQITNVFSKTKTPAAMRDAFARRIVMAHTSGRLRRHLAESLANLPPKTFANPTEDHVTIWRTPELYEHAAPFIATIADLPPEQALPLLDETLNAAIEIESWSNRRAVVHGICEALIRLGPDALAVEPRIRELFLSRPSPIMNTSKDANQWRFALARMGVAVESLPFFPSQSTDSINRITRQISDRLQRYERDQLQGNQS